MEHCCHPRALCCSSWKELSSKRNKHPRPKISRHIWQPHWNLQQRGPFSILQVTIEAGNVGLWGCFFHWCSQLPWRSLCPTVLLTSQSSKAFGNMRNLSAASFLINSLPAPHRTRCPKNIDNLGLGFTWSVAQGWERKRARWFLIYFCRFGGIFCGFIEVLISTASPALSSTEINKMNICVRDENVNEAPP